MLEEWDVVIIGGGASGFFTAITIGEQSPHRLRILILEKSSQPLGKVKISGGGRCNVTHQRLKPKELAKHYPRGEKALIGPFHRWNANHTIEWFDKKGVDLKTESDGRMFPTTDSSQTIIDALQGAAEQAGVTIQTKCAVTQILSTSSPDSTPEFELQTSEGPLKTKKVVLAMGGTRAQSSVEMIQSLGLNQASAVPSLFTFKVNDPELTSLSGLAVKHAKISLEASKLITEGPVLITHWGVSGPGILRHSAWGARLLADKEYRFSILINWLPRQEPDLTSLRDRLGKKKIAKESPFPEIPKRLWAYLCSRSKITPEQTWSQMSKTQRKALHSELSTCRLKVEGKSLNKDEFVTCGGIELKELHLKTMESKKTPNLYAVGEVLNVDGITGGFNFQNAWTTGYHAGVAIADSFR